METNLRTRMIVKAGEVCYRHTRMKKEHRKMWLSYPYKKMIARIKEILEFLYGR